MIVIFLVAMLALVQVPFLADTNILPVVAVPIFTTILVLFCPETKVAPDGNCQS